MRQTPRGGDSVTSLSANALNAIDASGGCETGRRREVTTAREKLIEATEGHEVVVLDFRAPYRAHRSSPVGPERNGRFAVYHLEIPHQELRLARRPVVETSTMAGQRNHRAPISQLTVIVFVNVGSSIHRS